MNIRKNIYWTIDRIRGGHLKKNYYNIKFINESSDLSLIKKYHLKKMNDIIKVIQNIPFYQNKNYSKLDDFPVINKSMLKNELDKFISKEYKRKELQKVITSGSTGTPFTSYQSKYKKSRNSMDTLYFSELAGYELGRPLFYLKIWSENNNKSIINQFIQNIIPVDVINLSNDKIKSLLSKIASLTNVNINSYASSLETICNNLEKEDFSINNISSIIAQSEALGHETKERLSKYFNCIPCSRYSNIENGIIAQQTLLNNDKFRINHASYIVEILDLTKDIRAKKGEYGRIVITDLYNYAMPFIRYDTGDIGRFTHDKSGVENELFLSDIQGRKLDLLLNTKGEIISSFIMYKNMYKYPEINQYQLIQEEKNKYRFIINLKGKFNYEKQLKSEFLSYLGTDAIFNIEYVDNIPLLNSGKRRKVVNNYIKQ